MDKRQRTEAMKDFGLKDERRGLWGAKRFSTATPLSSVFCRLSSRLCSPAVALAKASLLSFVLSPFLLALAAPEPTVQVGVVAQRYPWNGVVDVTCKVANAPKDAPLLVFANGVEVVRVAATNGEQKVAFDANKIDALKGKKLKDVKIAAKVEGGKE